jgi:hypothetical protein
MTAQQDSLREIVDEQAEDEGLWFVAVTASEAYLQEELRRLHAAIEAALPRQDKPGLTELRTLVAEGIEVIRLTREYVDGTAPDSTDGLLPALPGWPWFDWMQKARAALAASPSERCCADPGPHFHGSRWVPAARGER